MKRSNPVRIVVGTRGSQLAVIQTEQVLQALEARWPDLKCETKIIKTRGDDPKTAIQDIRAGRKGLFTGAIERALLQRHIDLAVHSAKDLPSTLTPGTEIGAVLPRVAADDVLVFGPETRGLGDDLLQEFAPDMRLRLPMRAGVRSINLSNAVAVAVFEAWRQLGFRGASAPS